MADDDRRAKADPDNAAGNIASGLARLITPGNGNYEQQDAGRQELGWGIAEALRYLKGEGDD